MAGLRKTDHRAEVIWLGYNPDRAAGLRTVPVEELALGFGGHGRDAHAGETRPSCGRVLDLYPHGTEIRNTRQLSIIAVEELDQIARNMELDALDPAWLGVSILIEGIADFSHVPPSSRLQADNGTTITVDVENGPCNLPAKVIDEDEPGKGTAFKQAAVGLRGVTAWVERPGRLVLGDALTLFVPDQPAWQG